MVIHRLTYTQGKSPYRKRQNKTTRRDGQTSPSLVRKQNNNASFLVCGATQTRKCSSDNKLKELL